MKFKMPNIKLSVLKLPTRQDTKENAELKNARLFIDCRSCSNSPGMGQECVKCIVSKIVRFGEPERLLLRTSRDMEYRGEIIEILNKLAKADMLANSVKPQGRGRCSSCSCEPSELIGGSWKTFPEPDMDTIRITLKRFRPETKECEDCVISTYRSVEQLDYVLKDAVKTAARSAFSMMEV